MRKMTLLATIVVLLCNASAEGQDWSALGDFDRAKLEGQWMVVSVDVDGDLTKAQIGQRPGDVITLSSDVNVGLPQVG